MKYFCLALILFLGIVTNAQVGINTTTPNAQLDIQSSSQVAPSNTDGILIPKIDVFPAINPTIAQQGMLVYLTTATTFSGNPKPIGFYYWNNSPADWIAVKGTDGGTLDQAYDFGGAGLGRTITADTGAVTIAGTDGLVSTGNIGSGALAPSGSGTRMVWNPRKAAFRAGTAFGTQWDDASIGSGSVAFGNSIASGNSAFAGSGGSASGTASFAYGGGATATGQSSFAFGQSANASVADAIAIGFVSTASGSRAVALGSSVIASGQSSTAFGAANTASGFASTAFGGGTLASGSNSTSYGRDNSAFSFGETVLGIGATTYTPTTNGATQFRTANATDRLFVIGNAIDADNDNVVDTAERSDAMVVLKNGATGIGTSLPNALLDVNATDNGILIPRVALTSLLVQAPIVNPQGGVLPTSTMVYNTATAGVSPNNVSPGFYYWNTSRWARFDVGGENNPTYYTAVGTFNAISISVFSSLSQMSVTFTPKDDVAMVHFSAAGHRFDDNCPNTAIFFQIVLNGIPVTGWQTASKQSIVNSSLFDDDITTWDTNFSYPITVTIGTPQTIQIQWASPDCQMGNNPGTPFSAFGSVFRSYRTLTVIDPNGGGGIVGSPPVTTNLWALNGNTGTSALTNFVGTADNQPLRFRTANTFAGNISNTTGGLVSLGFNAGPVNTGFSNTFFGGTAGLFNTTGDSNTFIGQGAGAANTTTSNNTYIGTGAGQSNATGNQNVYVGTGAGGNGTTGSDNILIGNGAGVLNTANNNIMIGSFAGNANSTGAGNTYMGTMAGAATSTGGQNTFVGTGAGGTNTIGTQNTLIGNGAALNANNLINAAAIGHASRVDVNNGLVLGSVNGVNSATSTSLVGIGTTAPLERLHVAGRAFLTDGFSADNAALVYKNNTDYMFLGPQSGSSANGAAMALFGSTNVSGGNAGGVDFNVPSGQLRISHNNGNYIFRANSTSGYNATFELNDVGLQIGHNSASRALVFNTASTERVRITPTGDLGVGTTTPAQKLHVSGPAGLTAVRIGNTSTIGATANVALDFFRNTAANTDWRIYNIGANLTIGNSGDDLATVNDLYQFQGARFMPMTDATINLGQAANRWNTLFASNGTINTSDARAKKNIQNLSYGLKEILRLRPVSFEWKKDDGSGRKLGLIAQELQQVLPETVRDWDWETNEQGIKTKVDSPLMGVYYSDIIPVLVKATQEQQLIIEQQQAEINLLKTQLEVQNNKITTILQRLENLENKN